jgi:hypothetical protein
VTAVGVASEPVGEAAPRRWEDTEPGFRETLGEIARLFRRARKRPWVVVLLTIVLTALLVVRSARRETSYGATVKLLVTESEQEAESEEIQSGSRIYSNDKLREFIANAAFTDGKVLEVLKQNDFRTRDIENNPRLVLQSFREDVEIDVYRNHFVEAPMGAPRTANIAIGFRMNDPDKALAIVRDLGDLVVERDAAYRRDAYEAARAVAGHELQLIKQRIDEIDAEKAEAIVGRDMQRLRIEKGEYKYRIHQLDQELLALSYALNAARDRYEEVKMMDNAGSMGLRFDRIDWGAAEMRVNKKLAVARFGLIVLVLSWPFVAMAVGGFDRRVYDAGDVRRLGLRAFGTVRAPAAASPRRGGPDAGRASLPGADHPAPRTLASS